MRSHRLARGLVVSGLLAIIVGVILIVGMLQSFSSGNTETGVALLVLLAANVLGNVIYRQIAAKRARTESNSKAFDPVSPPAAQHGVSVPSGPIESSDTFSLHDAVLDNDVEAATSALAGGVSVDAKYEDFTPLHNAAGLGHLEVARLLLDNDADPNSKSSGGGTPLHLAATYGHVEVARLLISSGADLVAGSTGTNANGITALHFAAGHGQAEVAELLLTSGADPNIKDSASRTPLDLAARNGHSEAAQVLLRRGADPNVTNDDGLSPLFLAGCLGYARVVAYLLANGADVNLCGPGLVTPLHAAVSGANAHAVKSLLVSGADPNAKTDDGRTPLAMCDPSDERIQRLLREHGARE